MSEAINAAISQGQDNVSLVVIGVVGLAALGFGLTMLTGMLRR